jgi:hypothetical protein
MRVDAVRHPKIAEALREGGGRRARAEGDNGPLYASAAAVFEKKMREASAEDLRRLAKSAETVSQGRRLLSLAAVLDGMSRADAARIGGMDRQTLRDWVHRFNAAGPPGLLDNWSNGKLSRLSAAQQAELAAMVDAGDWAHIGQSS